MHDRTHPPVHRWRPAVPARLVWTMLLGLLALWVGPARAGNLPGDLPTLVGRLQVVSGEVQLMDRDSGRWQDGDNGNLDNWPVAAGDRLRLGRDARAELRVGSNTLRLGGGAQLLLQQLDEQGVVLQLQDGSLALRLAAVDGDAFGPVELRTREGRWLPRRPGHYRFDREADATQASVWRGELQFEGHDSALVIPEGRRADLWLDKPDSGRRAATRYAWAAVERDGFADWVARDERQDDAPLSARYVPPGVSGWQDLDRHGDWVGESEHGPLWLPRAVAPGWAPYQVGRWAWVAPWGWTWIDAAPWGFAPFHYGSWLRFDGRWAWSPGQHGPRGPRVRYAPALSAWIGGPSVGVTVQIGGRRPPPPRVVVPAVPVVVVRPGHHRPQPVPVVVAPRPGWQVDGRRDDRRDGRRDDWRDDRRDGRVGGGADGRGDSRPERGPDNRNAGPGDDRRDNNRRDDDRRNDNRPNDNRDAPRANRPVERPAEQRPVHPVTRVQQPAPVAQAPDVPRMVVPRPVVRAPQPAEPAAQPQRPPRGADEPRGPDRMERPDQPNRVDRPDRPDRPERPARVDNDNRRDTPRSGPNRGNERDLAR